MDSLRPPTQAENGSDMTMRIFLCCCGLFLFLTMPILISPGDPYASRAEAAHLAMTGHLGFDYAERGELHWFLDKRGEYFFENDSKQKLFNKWGIMNTLCYLPPMLATKAVAGRVELIDRSPAHLFFVNLNNILFSILILYYLYRTASLYTAHDWQRVIFVTLAAFTTYLWYYLRTQTHETFQLAMALGFFYHFLVFLRASDKGDSRGQWSNLGIAMSWAGLLFLTKVLYITIIGAAWPFALSAGPAGVPLLARVVRNLRDNKRPLTLALLLPTLIALIAFLTLNYYKTGSCLETGYGQETFEGVNQISFSPRVLLESIPGLFFLKGNGNLLLHYPLLLLALFGFRRFAHKWPSDSAFLLFVVLSNCLIIASYQTWRGEWSYGPRYFIIFAIIASLPTLESVALITERLRSPLVWGGTAFFGLISLWSLAMQISVNSVESFTYYYHKAYFEEKFNDPEINRYFTDYLTWGTLYADMLAYRFFDKDYYPFVVIKTKGPDWYAENEQQLNDDIQSEIKLNYLLPVLIAKL